MLIKTLENCEPLSEKQLHLGQVFTSWVSITALASLEAARPTLEVKTDPSCNYFSLSGSQFSLDFLNISQEMRHCQLRAKLSFHHRQKRSEYFHFLPYAHKMNFTLILVQEMCQSLILGSLLQRVSEGSKKSLGHTRAVVIVT